MARWDFVNQLQELGYQVTAPAPDRVAFAYSIPVGRLAGQEIRLGFVVGDDFPLNPPSGPHVTPHLFPIQAGGVHPNGGIHASPFGSDWQYWSRPFPDWDATDRTVRTYLAHIRHLFATL